jgi:CBS domain-containing protein
MSTSLVAVTPETRIGDAARRMVEHDVGAAIVLADGDDLVGVITERDLLRCVSEGIDPSTPSSERMTRHVLTAGPTAAVDTPPRSNTTSRARTAGLLTMLSEVEKAPSDEPSESRKR